MTRPRMAIVQAYWDLWEHTAGPTFRADRLEIARRVAAELADAYDAVTVADAASVAEGAALGERLKADPPEALLVIVSMAAPPAYVLAVLDALPDVPVVVWALHETGLVGGDFDHGGITTQGATVGGPMLTNVLARRARPSQLILGRHADDATGARVREALQLAVVATSIRRARLGRIGQPIDGYLHVDLDDAELANAMGITTVDVDPDEVVEAWRAITAERISALEAEVRATWQSAEDVEAEGSLERSLRAALALEDVVERHQLDGGAFNCHVPQFRFGDEIGIAPCWGLGRLTSMGKPFSCTGDIVTAVAMLTTKRLGAAALYHEIVAVDYETGEVTIANSGEHDLAWLAPGETPRLRRNGWYCGKDPRCGVCRRLRTTGRAGHAGRLHTASRRRGRFPLRGRQGRADRAAFPRDGHGQWRLPLPPWLGRGGLDALGRQRRQPPQLGHAR